MKLKIIKHGDYIKPVRGHYNDSGLDVRTPKTFDLKPFEPTTIKLGLGFDIPDGYEIQIRPRSSMNLKGILTQFGTVDAGYKGEIAATFINLTPQTYHFEKGDKIVQLVLAPVVYFEPVIDFEEERGEKGFGSTGK